MSAYENATAFFHACEGLQGWEGCRQYVADGAGFVAVGDVGLRLRLGGGGAAITIVSSVRVGLRTFPCNVHGTRLVTNT